MRSWWVFVLLVLLSVPADAFSAASSKKGNWLSFKGSADRLGLSSSSAVDLPLKIRWKHSIEGKTNGFVDFGPVAADGMVYTGDGLNHVLALDAKTGKVLWNTEVKSNIFSVTLSEDAQLLYVTIAITTKPTPTLFALNAKTGEVVWDNMVNNQPAMGGMEGAPAVAGGKVFVGHLQYDGFGGIAAFEGKDGKLIWYQKVERISPYSSITYSNSRIYVGFENKKLYCLSAEDGKILWSQDMADLPYAAAAVQNGKVFLGTGNTVYSLDAASGAILWTKAIEGQIGHSSVSVYKNILYVGTRESKVFALSTKEGSLEWMSDLKKGPIESSFLIDTKKDVIYLGTQENRVIALALKNGKLKGELLLSDNPRGVWKNSPALYDGMLYIGSLDRTFYALE